MAGPAPYVDLDNHRIVILAFILSSQRTTLVYSAQPNLVDQIQTDGVIQLTDDSGHIFPFQDSWRLATLNGLEFGILNFRVRSENSRQLVFQIGRAKEADHLVNLSFAQSQDNPPWNIQSHFYGVFSQMLADPHSPIRQEGFEIAFYAWAYPHGEWPGLTPVSPTPIPAAGVTLSAQTTAAANSLTTSTPYVIPPLEPKTVDAELTFVVNDLKKTQTRYLYFQFYTDGTAKAILLEK